MGSWILEKGFVLAYNAQATIIHIHEETPKKIFNRYKREAIALKNIFPDSHLSFVEFVLLWMSNVLLDLLRSLKQGKFISNIIEILVFRTMQYLGTYRGIHNRSPLTHEMIMKFYYPRKLKRLRFR